MRDSINPTLNDAIAFLSQSSTKPPTPEAVVEALLTAEKTAKQTKVNHNYSQLLGTWRLRFITGTKRSRQRAGIVLGAGRFLPKWVKIQLSYFQSESNLEQGTVTNSVQIGSLQLVVTGPTQFFPKMNILAFDFTRIKVSVFGLTLYNGFIRGGQERDANFYTKPLKNKAFFSYFIIQNNIIAARGRGGGLALWIMA